MARLIGKRTVPSLGNGGGVWGLNEVAKFRRDGIWPTLFSGARYWRINFADSHYGLASVIVSEIEMKSSIGGTDLTTGKTASASIAYEPAANAIDNNNATFWQAFNALNVVLPAWLMVDFVDPVVIVEYTIRAEVTQTSSAPKTWTLQYSTNNTDWLDMHTVNNAPGWSSSELRTYNGYL
jgi:hypothetical protein